MLQDGAYILSKKDANASVKAQNYANAWASVMKPDSVVTALTVRYAVNKWWLFFPNGVLFVTQFA